MGTLPNRNVRDADFRELYDRLPDDIKKLAVAAFERFCENPMHPSLRTIRFVMTSVVATGGIVVPSALRCSIERFTLSTAPTMFGTGLGVMPITTPSSAINRILVPGTQSRRVAGARVCEAPHLCQSFAPGT
jgi:hypothetical protein